MSEPIDFVRELVARDPQAVPSSLRVLRRQSWATGQVVLYRFRAVRRFGDGTERTGEVLGCQVFRRGPEGWMPCGGSGFEMNPEVPPGRLLQFTTGTGQFTTGTGEKPAPGRPDSPPAGRPSGPREPAGDLPPRPASGGGAGEQGRYALVYGWASSPDVSAVEAEFDTGAVVRSDAADRCFVVVAAGAVRVLSLRAYDRSGKMLWHETWPRW